MLQLGPSVPLWSFCILLVVMALKHFIADFVFQTKWIAHGKERAQGWLAPLAVHVLLHGALTLCVALLIAPRLWWLAVVDVIVHTVIDRCKTLISQWGSWRVEDTGFWWILGFDQFMHQITNVALAAAFLML